jgi:hypothetical protein
MEIPETKEGKAAESGALFRLTLASWRPFTSRLTG